MEGLDLTHRLPKEILEDGAKFYEFKMDGMIKYVITNPKKNYRNFIYVLKTRDNRNNTLYDLYDTYRADNMVYSETQLYSMGLITKKGRDEA